MKNVILVGPALLLLVGASSEFQAQPTVTVSMVQLISMPHEFDGKTIRVVGFLSLGEENELFLHHEDYDHVISANALWLDRTPQMWRDREKLDLNYVTVVGTFRIADKNRIAAGITGIKSCELWSESGYPMRRRIEDMLNKNAKQ